MDNVEGDELKAFWSESTPCFQLPSTSKTMTSRNGSRTEFEKSTPSPGAPPTDLVKADIGLGAESGLGLEGLKTPSPHPPSPYPPPHKGHPHLRERRPGRVYGFTTIPTPAPFSLTTLPPLPTTTTTITGPTSPFNLNLEPYADADAYNTGEGEDNGSDNFIGEEEDEEEG
ncbi:hypothetical protein D9758_016373 [Tetrapyrgos nigripes]|uniref:Uncharacterized protein n=1 Tax=Tetrapyrgos nigripes TaxID=182062 RepID=A0A8H5CDH3_9AGAR|nr:hypothetical protein D9758_016373 [Tetrapyrgos nigripes]